MKFLTTHWLKPNPSRSSAHSPSLAKHTALTSQHATIRYGTSFWSVWISCPGCVPSQLCLGGTSLAGEHEKLKSPWLCVNAALQQQKHWCVISIAFTQNSKQSNTPATKKKITSQLKPGHPILEKGNIMDMSVWYLLPLNGVSNIIFNMYIYCHL